MTEIPIFPGGAPGVPGDIPEPAEGDWHGLFRGIHLHLGRIANNLPDPRRNRLEKSRAVWPVRLDPIPVQLVSGAGVLDSPNLLGPGMGYNWDIHSISATGFTAGTVAGWINVPLLSTGIPQGSLQAPFTQAGVLNYGKGQLLLNASERLVFIAAGITGTVLISMRGTSVSDPYLAEYLL